MEDGGSSKIDEHDGWMFVAQGQLGQERQNERLGVKDVDINFKTAQPAKNSEDGRSKRPGCDSQLLYPP